MHSSFMLEALDEARRFRGYCAPNPPVGAIATKGHEVLARAAHQGAGAAHAEINLLNQLEGDLSEVKIYVTLEPCNHWGRTPPCVKHLIERNVGKVIYGFADPNPIVKQNNTPKILKDHGIEVLHHPLPEIDQFYQSYHYWIKYNRPWVTVKVAISLDGRIAKKGNVPIQLSNELCRSFTHKQRHCSDIILTTARTILSDDPLLNVRIGEQMFAKPLAIIDRGLNVPKTAKAIQSAKLVLQFHQKGVNTDKTVTNQHFSVSNNRHGLDMDEIIGLIGEQGYHDLWVEAGGKLFSYLHKNKLVQRTYIFVTPTILGNEATPAFPDMLNWNEVNPKAHWLLQSDNAILCLEWWNI